MIVEREYYVKLSEIGKENKITNKALLGILEDIGGVHSNIAGYGIPTMDKTHLTWILLDWKVQVIRRPNYAEKILARTWSKEGLKYYAYRDFEVVDEQGNVIVKAISRWVLVNIETGKMERITDEILSKYQPESNKCVFEDETFDIVIANHMLFHVPDLNKALLEVKRVLKDNGVFYSATDGNGGMRPFLHNAIVRFEPTSTAFTEQLPFNLQNGSEILSKYFKNVQRFDYENILAITNTQDLIEWLKSTKSISGYSDESLLNLYNYFEDIRVKDGAINIPRETGVFISVK